MALVCSDREKQLILSSSESAVLRLDCCWSMFQTSPSPFEFVVIPCRGRPWPMKKELPTTVCLVAPVEPSLATSGCRFQIFATVRGDDLDGFVIYNGRNNTNQHDLAKWEHLHHLGKKLPHVRNVLKKEGISITNIAYAYRIGKPKPISCAVVQVTKLRCGFGTLPNIPHQVQEQLAEPVWP